VLPARRSTLVARSRGRAALADRFSLISEPPRQGAQTARNRRLRYTIIQLAAATHLVLAVIGPTARSRTSTLDQVEPQVDAQNQASPQPTAWRVDASLLAQMLTPNVIPSLGQQLTFISRLVPKVATYGNTTVALLPSSAEQEEGAEPKLEPGQEWVHLIADVPGTATAANAVEAAIEIFEPILDTLSFVLGSPLRLGAFKALDITPPVTAGDVREVAIYSGPPLGTNISSVDMECIRGAQFITLPDAIPAYDAKAAAALRWYYKALNTALLHDQFIFLWIALEILCDLSPLSIAGPYQAPCNHTIKHCPECGRSTEKEIRGRTIRHYLEVSFGVSQQASAALWRMRQMMHGAINFELGKLQQLPSLVQPLRAAVADGVKRQIGIANHGAPQVLAAGLSINPHLGAGGTTPVRASDIEPLADKVATYETKMRDSAAGGQQISSSESATEQPPNLNETS